MPWYAYKMIDFEPPGDLTLGFILKSMKAFEKDFIVNAEPHVHPNMIAWTLELEDKGRRMRTRSRDQSRTGANASSTIRKYICSLSIKENLFFINRCFNKKMQLAMTKALRCKDFRLLDMDSGNPTNLRLLYKQSNNEKPGELEFQYHSRAFSLLEEVKSGIPIYNTLDIGPDKLKKTHISLGTNRSLIPHLSNVKVSVKNAPIKSENPKLQDFRFSQVEMQVSAPSVFHLYLDFAEKGIIKDLPPWLLAMRSRGSTQVKSLYN